MYNIPYTNKQINIPYLLKIGNEKFKKLGKYLIDKNMQNIVIFHGDGIDNIIDGKIMPGLKSHNIHILRKETVGSIDIADIAKIAFALPSSTNAIVGVGGGKALDFAKYCSHLLKLPFISMPTSTSNDGFCSPSASLIVEDKRRTAKANIPFGVVVDLDVIKESPLICIYSGLGDMVSKVTALADWKKASHLGKERYNDFASMMAYNSLDLLFIKHSYDVNSPEFQRSLTNSLLTSGIAMEIAGTSRPASGSEHLISHALDKICKKPKMHGLQVGVATYLCALLQDNPSCEGVKEILIKTGFIDVIKKDKFDKKEFIEALSLAPSIKPNYYTVLSEEGSFARAVNFIETDAILREIIV